MERNPARVSMAIVQFILVLGKHMRVRLCFRVEGIEGTDNFRENRIQASPQLVAKCGFNAAQEMGPYD